MVKLHNDRAIEVREEVKELKNTTSNIPVAMLNHFKLLPCKEQKKDINWLTWGVKLLWGVVIVAGLLKGFNKW